MQSIKSLKLGILALLLVTLIIFSGCGGGNPVTPPIDDELDYDEVDRFDSITDSDGLSTFNLEEDIKINVKVEDEKTGTPLIGINVDMFVYEGKIVYLVVDPSEDYLPKIILEEQSYKDYLSQSKFPIISTIVKLIERTEWAIEGYTSGGAQFSDQIDNKFLKYLFDYIFQYGGKATLGDLKYSMKDTIITFCDTGLNLAIIPILTISGPIGWASIAIDAFDMGDTFAVAQWAKKYESLDYSDSDYFEVYYWIPAPYFPSIKIPFYPVIVPMGEPGEFSVESINGDITNISPLTDYFTLNTWYTAYVYVKNTGSVAHTFTVRGVEYIGSSALDFDEEEKSISLEVGNSGYLSFEYTCSGDTDDRVLLFRLYENADDEPLHYIDQMTKTICFEGNHPPVISNLSADPPSVNINQTTTITCSASDPDGDPLTYHWTKNVGSFEGSTSGSSVTWRAPSTADIYTVVSCEVRDGKGGEDSKSVNIVVTESDENEIKSVCSKLISALNNKNWNKARSYCIYGSEAYNQICDLENLINNWESWYASSTLNINTNINNVVINGRYAIVYGYFSYIFTAGTYVEENSGNVTGYLEKIGNNWEVYEGIIPNL